MNDALVVRDLTVSYGAITAVRSVSLRVKEGEIVGLIGSNGAGKSSTLRAISGMTACTGTVSFQGRAINGLRPETIAALGISHVPEGRGIFGNLSVSENLRLAAWSRSDQEGVRQDYRRVLDLFPRLKEREKQPGGTLSGGEQQMLAIARALMNRPRLLLLDEPSMGLAPLVVEEIFHLLTGINREGTSILCVEQNARLAMELAARVYIMESGAVVLEGAGAELAGNPAVREAYLGM